MALRTYREAILEPDLPIIDPHHHLWDRRAIIAPSAEPPRHAFAQILHKVPIYLPDELTADLTIGHDVLTTVYMECGSMYRADGPEALKPVGETEFVAAAAAKSIAHPGGKARICAGIVGHANLMLGGGAAEVLEAHLAAGDGRFRGIRHSASYDADPNVLGMLVRHGPGVYLDAAFREGFARLAPMNLSFDAWVLEPQLPDLIDLARAFPDTTIVLDHVGTPLGIGAYAGRREERFGVWRDHIRQLAALPRVNVKLGGLAMPFAGFPSFFSEPPATSTQLAAEWKPYIETCIDAFGPKRCMFESNFPVDIGSCDYDVLWNAFKVLAAGYSADEKTTLFSDTARRVYRLDA